MFVHNHIKEINRRKVKRTNTASGHRLDMAERLIDFDQDFINNFLSLICAEDFSVYPQNELEEEIKEKIANLNGLKSKNVMIDGGSDAIIRNILQTFCDPKKNLVINSPSFPMYEVYALSLGLKVDKQQIKTFDSLNIKELTDSSTLNKASVVVIINPGSPFGFQEPVSKLREFAAILAEQNIMLIIDEAYIDFGSTSCEDLVKFNKNVIIVRTFSKAWGAAGCRVGFCLAHEEIISNLDKVRLTYPISNISLMFINYLLDNDHVKERYSKASIQARDKLIDKFNEAGFTALPTQNNFVFIGATDTKIKNLISVLVEYQVAFKDISNSDFPLPQEHLKKLNWIGISIGAGILETEYIKKIFDE